MASQPRCWCGSADLKSFSPDYLVCGDCGTLVIASMPGEAIARVDDEEHDFYGRRYWFEYQERELGNPDITVRARTDLPERCVYWLRTVLRHRRPPGRVLDVGCGHGAFVMLLRRAGFDASGLELSPWVVDFARHTFCVPVLLGPIEAQSLSPGSLDVISMMDVVEHLTEPVATLATALSALGKDGILVIQTPAVPPSLTWEEMVAANHPFLPLMRERGHLYLFNETSLRRLLVERLGLQHVRFEPPYFGEYDMFVVASRRPIEAGVSRVVTNPLGVNPDGRLVQALLDLDESLRDLRTRHADVERDRAARLTALQEQGNRLMETERERNALHAELQNFRGFLEAAEEDRAARLVVIRDLGECLAAAENDRAARLAVIQELSERLAASERDRADRLAVIQELSERLAASERDRADRLAVIQELSERLAASERDRADRLAVIQGQGERLAASEQDQTDRLALIRELGARLAVAEADQTARLTLIEEQTRTLAEMRGHVDELEAHRVSQTGRLDALASERDALKAARDALAAERDALKARLASLRFLRARDMVRNLIRGRLRRQP